MKGPGHGGRYDGDDPRATGARCGLARVVLALAILAAMTGCTTVSYSPILGQFPA